MSPKMSTTITPEDTPAIAPRFRLQWEPAQDAWVILYPEGMVKLNQAAGEILSRCDGKRTVAALIEDLMDAFPGAEGLETDVYNFLGTADERNWIQRGTA